MENLNDLEILDVSKSLTNKETAQQILMNFEPLLRTKIASFNGSIKLSGTDSTSMALLPWEFKEWVPLITPGDGNCLFNSVSMSLVGDTTLANLLRMLTAAELFAHSEFYARHPHLENFAKAAKYTLPSIVAIFLSHNKAENAFSGNLNNAPKAIEILAQETAKPYVYSSPFIILALSSVIGQPIFAVYPDEPSALSMKLATHGFYYPRNAVIAGLNLDDIKSNAIYVMWTRTDLLPIKPWCPNHFVLLKNKNQFNTVKSYAAAAATCKNPPSSSSHLPKTTDSPLFKSKWKCKKVVGDKKEQSRTRFTDPAGTKSSSSARRTDEGYAEKHTPPGSNMSPSSGRKRNGGNAATPSTGYTNRGSTMSPPSKRETKEDKTVKPPRKKFHNNDALDDKRSPSFGHSQESKFTENVENVKLSPNKKAKVKISPVKIPTENPSASLSTPQSARISAIPEMFCTPRVRRQKRSKGATVEEKPTGKIKKIDSFFTPATPRPQEVKVENSSPGSAFLGTETDSNNEDETEDVLPLKGPGFQWYTERGINLTANMARSEERTRNPVIVEENQMKGLIRGTGKGTLAQNVEDLIERVTTAGSSKQQNHLSAMISLAHHIIENGLLVPTQDLVKKYKEFKGLKESSCLESSRLLEIMSKHLNVAQIYIDGKGYIIENHGKEIVKIVESLQQMGKTDQTIVNQRVEEAIGSTYDTLLQYLDSKRDRDTVKAILTQITSAKFMGKLANVQDKRSFQYSKGTVARNLQLFEDMKSEIQVIDPSKTEEAKRKKRNRLLQAMKLEKLRHVFKGRGRKLKCEEFPDLTGILEFAFGESDRVDRAGGGLESHPRLTDTVLYRAADSNTIMKQARETILALAPEGFSISLSTCFNYTQNYREGTYQAKRHHSGRGKPPRIGVEQFVINVHWSTQNVNLTLDLAHSLPNCIMVDSKDAKAKIHSDVSPVQKPGKTWRKVTLPDHDWNRSSHNAITPMSHLLMETELHLEEKEEQRLVYSVRRTGTAATLLNLSHFEPETVHRVFNEIFLLLRNPALDHLFRNPDTGKLKEHFAFIVDNGPSEAPSSPMVRMWLVRLARILKLKSVTQKSFAEYHSKRNPVERVHAAQNHALSNEIFSSKGIYPEYDIGDEKHKANMEHMAEEVRKCLANVQYGGKPCVAMRGIGGQENFIFNDEEHIVSFLGKNENRKAEDTLHYRPIKNDLWREVATVWDLDENYTGSYREDYQILQNTFHEEGQRTCWVVKYSTIIFNPDIECELPTTFFTVQPVPDYVRWMATGGEMHYLPLEKVQKLNTQIISDTPAAFLPSKILEMVYKVFSQGVENILRYISFLAWCTETDVTTFCQEYKEKLDKSFLNDKEREYWSQDPLYQENDKEHLQQLCRKEGLSIEGKKHECVKRLSQKMGCAKPPSLVEYNGDILCIPDSVTEIAKMSVFKLREILRVHNVLDCDNKDELVVRVGMVKGGRSYLAFHRELEAIRNIVNATRTLIIAEKSLYLEDPKVIHKRRKFATPSGPSMISMRPRDTASTPHQTPNAYLPLTMNYHWTISRKS